MSFSSSSLKRVALLAAAVVPVALITGCSMTSTANPSAEPLVSVSGHTLGGRAPISGASVTLYDAGSTGYGSVPTVLGTATSDAGGGFSIARNANTCADPDQLYVVSTGGNAGASSANGSAFLVEALGTCSTITTATTGLVINELTTVAAAYTLAGFASVNGSSINIGTTPSNTLGLQHAFANAANLVTLNGQARTTTVGGNGTVPTAVLNTLADALASCVQSDGTGTGCSNIFVAPPAGVSTGTPANTWQAALNMALYPGNNVTNVFNNQGTVPFYLPNLTTLPLDLSVGIAYTTGTKADGTTATGFPWDIKADSNGNIWISGQTSVGLAELSSTGALLSPAGGWGSAALQASSARTLAVDNLPSPNIWVADNAGNLFAYNPASNTTNAVPLPTSITVGATATTVAKAAVGIGVDSNNNVWYSTEASTATATQTLGEVPAGTFTAATSYSASPLFPESTSGANTLAVNAKTNDVWAGSQSTTNVYYFLSPYTNPDTASATTVTPVNDLAFDAGGNTWAVGQSSGADKGVLYKFASGSPALTPTAIAGPTGAAQGLYNPRALAIDGLGRLFVTSYTTRAAVVEFDPAINTAGTGSTTPSGYLVNSGGNGFNPLNQAGTAAVITTSTPRHITIDTAGAVWVANGNSTSLPAAIQIFGIAAPTQPVLAKGLYGARP